MPDYPRYPQGPPRNLRLFSSPYETVFAPPGEDCATHVSALPLFAFPTGTTIRSLPKTLHVGGRRLVPTIAFASYWYFAAERQAILFRRLRGDASLTQDYILRAYRFTNAYRAADRVSQFLINEVIPSCDGTSSDFIFRVLLFKIFNKIDTWQRLEHELGEPIHWKSFSLRRFDDIMTRIALSGGRLYSNAYIMPNPQFGHRFKHSNHLELLSQLLSCGIHEKIIAARSLKAVYELLRGVPSFGPFLAFQYAIDLNYGDALAFDEAEFVVAGPGAVSGIRKCFHDVGGYSDADVIRYMADSAPQHFDSLGLPFVSLWGRPLHLVDCQNVFCEVDKYSRLAHPELTAPTGRSRIKQRYAASDMPLRPYGFPKRWNLETSTLIDVPKVSF